jgi:hypothetical protein
MELAGTEPGTLNPELENMFLFLLFLLLLLREPQPQPLSHDDLLEIHASEWV